MLLASLDFRAGPSKYVDLFRIAKDAGHDVESITHDDSDSSFLAAYQRAREVIKEASAFVIPRSAMVSNVLVHTDGDHPSLAASVQARIKDGARVLCTPWIDEPAFDRWNGFLAPYDLTVSTLRIRNREGDTLACASPETAVTIQRSAHSFRDAALFRGVDQVILKQPVAIWYGGESLPILLATDAHLPIDARTDFLPISEQRTDTPFPPEWNARELACMAIWYGENDGAVMASIGPDLTNVTSEGNRQLAVNVLRWLCGTEAPLRAEMHCHRIEVNLVDFVLGAVKNTGDNWWIERIPLTIRQECAKRHEEEKCRWPKEAYLDLIDLKTIMSKEWKLFESHLRAAGCEGGKDRCLAWLDRLNEIRRMVGHPLKKHVAGHSFSDEEQAFLKGCDDLVRKLVRRVKTAL
jgi:hypothetical protein